MRPSRKVLRALCALSFAGGAALLALGARASLRAHLGAAAGAFCALGALVALLSLLGFVGAGRDKSALLMAFFFLNFLLVASLVVACYAAFFSHAALETWLKHHWAESVLAHLRETQAECQAFDTCATFLEKTVTRLGAIGAAIVVLAVLAMYCVVRIVTVPIVMKSMLTVVNAMFVALGAGLFIYGFSVKVHADMISGQHWIAILLIVAGTLLVALSVLGVIGARAKSRTLLLMYLIGIGACLGVLIVCAVSSFTLSGRLAATYESQWSSSSLSCDVGLYGCTNCTSSEFEECPGVSKNASGYWVECDDDDDSNDSASFSNSDDEDTSASRSTGNGTCWQGMTVLNEPEDQGYEPNDIAECMQCPEWSASDVDAYLRSVLHVLGLLALVVSLFVIVGMSGALVLRRSLAGYQTDSI